MTVVTTLDITDLTPAEYRTVLDELGVETRPERGIYLHLKTPTDFGFRIVEIWDEQSGFDRFLERRMVRATKAVAGVRLAIAAVAGDRDGGDAVARAGAAQLDVAGKAAVAGEGEHLRDLLGPGVRWLTEPSPCRPAGGARRQRTRQLPARAGDRRAAENLGRRGSWRGGWRPPDLRRAMLEAQTRPPHHPAPAGPRTVLTHRRGTHAGPCIDERRLPALAREAVLRGIARPPTANDSATPRSYGFSEARRPGDVPSRGVFAFG